MSAADAGNDPIAIAEEHVRQAVMLLLRIRCPKNLLRKIGSIECLASLDQLLDCNKARMVPFADIVSEGP